MSLAREEIQITSTTSTRDNIKNNRWLNDIFCTCKLFRPVLPDKKKYSKGYTNLAKVSHDSPIGIFNEVPATFIYTLTLTSSYIARAS